MRHEDRQRALRATVALLLVAGVALLAGATAAAGPRGSASSTATPMTVHFSFSSTPDDDDFVIRGSGKLRLPDVPADNVTTTAPDGSSTSTIRIVRRGSSATFRVFPNLYKYSYSFNHRERLVNTVFLYGQITRSTIASCHVGSTGEILVTDRGGYLFGHAELCRGGHGLKEGSLSITPSPRPSPMPTEVTLTVNNWRAMADSKEPSVHVFGKEPLAKNTALTIAVETDHPLPPGWILDVFHNGDVESPGNGVYYKVCELTKANTSCEEVRRGRVGPMDDAVWARMTSTTAVVLYAEIDFHFNP